MLVAKTLKPEQILYRPIFHNFILIIFMILLILLICVCIFLFSFEAMLGGHHKAINPLNLQNVFWMETGPNSSGLAYLFTILYSNYFLTLFWGKLQPSHPSYSFD